NITQSNSNPLAQQNSEIYLMDIRNYTWVNTFAEPIKPKNKNTATPVKIAIATICAIIGA
ncbi:8249_t:CDS:1, partial [Funneliformis mosseae]